MKDEYFLCKTHNRKDKFRQKDRVQELKKKLPVRASQVAAITTATERRTGKKKQEREKQRSEFQWVLHKWTCDLWHSAEGLVLTMLPSLPLFICPDTKSGEQTKLIWGCVLHNRKSPSLQSWKERTCRLDCTAAKKKGWQWEYVYVIWHLHAEKWCKDCTKLSHRLYGELSAAA